MHIVLYPLDKLLCLYNLWCQLIILNWDIMRCFNFLSIRYLSWAINSYMHHMQYLLRHMCGKCWQLYILCVGIILLDKYLLHKLPQSILQFSCSTETVSLMWCKMHSMQRKFNKLFGLYNIWRQLILLNWDIMCCFNILPSRNLPWTFYSYLY